MGVAEHLGIDLAEYDTRIRTFIPDYETMLGVVASAVPRTARLILDLGIGTGALAARCLQNVPRARIVGVDADEEILDAARRRLGPRATLLHGSFERVPLPACDAIVTSLALHHIRTTSARAAVYRRLGAALRPQGVLLTADCYPATARRLAHEQRKAWASHLRETYSPARTSALFAAWAKEDVYVPLSKEIELLEEAKLSPEVLWRKGTFAVIAASRR